eukprot:3879976-Rhodomonas_salina.1
MRALGKVLARSPDSVKALARVFLHWSEAQDSYGDSSSRASSKLARALAQLLDGEITISLESSDEEEGFAAGARPVAKAPKPKPHPEPKKAVAKKSGDKGKTAKQLPVCEFK